MAALNSAANLGDNDMRFHLFVKLVVGGDGNYSLTQYRLHAIILMTNPSVEEQL